MPRAHRGSPSPDLEAIDPLCAAVFTSIRHPAFGWPGTALVLSGTRPAVADLLVRQGVARRLAMYPSLDRALKSTRDRPPPATEAAGPGSGAHCGRRRPGVRGGGVWSLGLQGLAASAVLLANELVTNAVIADLAADQDERGRDQRELGSG